MEGREQEYICIYMPQLYSALVCVFCIDYKMLISCKIECTVTLFSTHFERLSFPTFSLHTSIVACGLWLDSLDQETLAAVGGQSQTETGLWKWFKVAGSN